MSLNEEIRHVLRTYAIPSQVANTLAAAIAELEENQAAPGLAVGETAPDFRLPSVLGGETSLSENLVRGPVVLTFYRGDWCPVCNLQLSALQRALPQIEQAGGALLAISPQELGHAVSLKEAHDLGFDLLSDTRQEVIQKYRLQFKIPAAVREAYTDVLHIDIGKQNADGTWRLPVPGTFIIGPEGVVRTRHVTADYTRRMEPEDVIAALESLQTPAGG